ncbi:MAG TPA: alpha/beta hydrolase [Thermoanaerobaculia bacterium]|nr:alpha/beta hydrolase [Thermoanaerobaculia bacterium]
MPKRQLSFFLIAVLAAAPALASHSGGAPIHPVEPDDEHFLVDTGSGLDTGCTFRDGSPLVFFVEVDRYVGEVDGSGFLRDPGRLVSQKVVSPKARLMLPAFDVDSSANVPPYAPEVDKVFFNGRQLSKPTLTGSNNTWIMNEFEVPIDAVKFPQRGARGSRPTPARNEIRIDIDTANAELVWCTSIDWAQLQFKAMAPILLVHGITAGPDTWEPAVTNYLEGEDVPFENNIQLGPNGSIANNGGLLSQTVQEYADSFGVKKVHLVVHSKGGLDSRRFLSTHYNPREVKVLSLHTLSTPHHGSVIADLSIANLTLNDATSNNQNLNAFMNQQGLANFFGQGPQRPGLDDLQTASMAAFNAANAFPGSVTLYTHGADADLNNDGRISNAEASPLVPGAANWAIDSGTLMYQILRNVASINVVRRTNFFGLNEWHEISANATAFPLDNDLSVTDQSSHYPPESAHFFVNRNHSNIKDANSLGTVLNRIRSDFPVN